MNHLFATLILLCGIACSAAQAAAPVLFSDGNFNDADWDIFPFTSGNGGASSSTQVATGGAPDSYRRTTITTNPAPSATTVSKVSILHYFDGATYDPSTQGAITSISYREDAIWLTGPSSLAFRTGVALRQNDRKYIVHIGNQVTGTETNWHAETGTWLQNDFHELIDDPIDGFDHVSFPNFRTGGPIEFGFFRTRTTNPGGGGGGPFTTGIDNWNVTINRVPEPGALALAAFGVGSLLCRRRHAV